jgi:tetratricopeptide (TPR) repeat protein
LSETVLTELQANLKAAIREGIDLWEAERYSEALSHFQSVKRFFVKSESVYLRHYYCNLGIVYRALDRLDLAIVEYERALEIEAHGKSTKSDVAAIKANLAYALMCMERFDEAHKYLNEAEKYFKKSRKHKRLAEVLETRARAYRAQGKIGKAEKAAHKAYKIMRRQRDAKAVLRTLQTSGMCWEAKQRKV